MKFRFFLVSLLFMSAISMFAQSSNDVCLGCHSDQTLSKEINKKIIPLFVDDKKFSSSVHKELECINCHEGFNAEDIPHKNKITPVNCSGCHDIEGYKNGIHDKNSVKCSSCHSKHEIKSAKLIENNFDICFTCHKKKEVSKFNLSSHKKSGLSCNSCHKSVHGPEKIISGRQNLLCLSCHKTDSPKLKQNIHHVKIDFSLKSDNKCIDCHNPHSAGSSSASQGSDNCMKCHLDSKRQSKNPSLINKFNEYNVSVHAKLNSTGKQNATCTDCHGSDMSTTKTNPNAPTSKSNQHKTCGKCHSRQSNEFIKSDHGIAQFSGVAVAPACTDCHGDHKILSHLDSASVTSRKNEKELCFKCHIKNNEVVKRVSVSTLFIKSFEKSDHYRAFLKGNLNAAVCSDCHSSHGILQASKPNSTVSKSNIAKSCSKCHQSQFNKYSESIHSVELLKGNLQSATCTDCHSEHEILESSNKSSQVYGTNIAEQACAKCHGDTRFSDKFGIIGNNYQSFTDSYHGLAIMGGSKISANCTSCHSAHDIKPSTDPTSSTNKANLPQTCGKCHAGANENFTKDPVHTQIEKSKSPILFWVSNIYIIMIIIVVGGMFFHNLIDFYRKSKRKLIQRRYPSSFKIESEDEDPATYIPSRLFLRMSFNERIQHVTLLVSFTVLVITGFALTYPNSWWVLLLRTIFGDYTFIIRSLLHRIAGVVLTAVSLYHIYYIFFNARGKQLIKDFLPVKKDISDVFGSLKYLLGKTNHPPKFDRFCYIEKAEYWALIWGTIVMAITGFMLWFSKDVINVSGKFYTDLATIIHFYEAWLATLSIIVWHLYFVMLNPDVYPINLAFLKGTISEEEMKHEHPLEYERLIESERKKSEKEASGNKE